MLTIRCCNTFYKCDVLNETIRRIYFKKKKSSPCSIHWIQILCDVFTPLFTVAFVWLRSLPMAGWAGSEALKPTANEKGRNNYL